MHTRGLVGWFFLAVGLLTPLIGAHAEQSASGWWDRMEVRDLSHAPVVLTGRWVVVVFISPECPVANGAIPVLNTLATDFASRGVQFVGAYADPAMALSVLRKHSADYGIGFATADDRAQRLARTVHATYTPEAFVFSREGALLYRGRIDDRVTGFGPARPTAQRQELREVLTALVAGHPSPFAERPGFGCSIPEPVKQ